MSVVSLHQVSLVFPHKTCFESFSAVLSPGARIGLVGRNGCGKSSLLHMMAGLRVPDHGQIRGTERLVTGFVAQMPPPESHHPASGGERFQRAFAEAMRLHPGMLLLDEPTNHLDAHAREALVRRLQNFRGILLVASHDPGLLRSCTDTLWLIGDGTIRVFHGLYDDALEALRMQRTSLEDRIHHMNRQKKALHQARMHEQERASKSRLRGQKHIGERKWPTVVSTAKATRAEETSGRKTSAIEHHRTLLDRELQNLRLPETPVPRFVLPSGKQKQEVLLCIKDGAAGWPGRPPLLSGLHLVIKGHDRVAITGRNGCGKSTLLKAITGAPGVVRQGEWHTPGSGDTGWMDQHYATLDLQISAFEALKTLQSDWSTEALWTHLNSFLFRKPEEVHTPARQLSGGEQARLCLALLAARTPRLLVLDELSNNLDLETRHHVLSILHAWPGAMVMVDHDPEFLEALTPTSVLDIRMFRNT
jgi:ATPase subunit of ABC transporter with duplicated ATPase domains